MLILTEHALGSHLERYTARFNAMEIDSSFYRSHRRATYERWAARIPGHFAFAVTAPKEMMHRLRLMDTAAALEEFLAELGELKEKIGPLLFQLPPSLTFGVKMVESFLVALRERFAGSVVCEPGSPDWFTTHASDLLNAFRIGRAVVHPAIVDVAAEPGGWSGVAYLCLHGAPRMDHSEYSAEQLKRLADQSARGSAGPHPVWCPFDNTAAGAATANALLLQKSLDARPSSP